MKVSLGLPCATPERDASDTIGLPSAAGGEFLVPVWVPEPVTGFVGEVTLTVLVGSRGGAATTPLAAEATGPPVPDALLADSVTRIVSPMSEEERVYDCATAPLIATQLLPVVSQSSHW
jgi:hypothetical protein